MSQSASGPTITTLFRPSLLEWRAKYLAAKAAGSTSSQPTTVRPRVARKRPVGAQK